RVPPKSVTVVVGEEEEETVLFDIMQYGDDGYLLASGQPVSEVYAEEGRIRVGSFTIGDQVTSIVIRVEDFAGNRASAEYGVTVISGSGAR
ncbi:MAG: hypothetical protein GVY29_11060, partial [Spirochaetes bacterium]|nr:hypothetical protein [Spirochaetota bacterium]